MSIIKKWVDLNSPLARYFFQLQSVEKQHVAILATWLPMATHCSHLKYIFRIFIPLAFS
jgi:hypothetical protein